MNILRTICLIIVTCAATVAHADDNSAQAKNLFTSGRQHFDLGEYREALRDFKEGYRRKDDPIFLYNIAQCHRLLKENSEAVRAYKVYLQRAPDAPNRDEVERKIAALEGASASQEKAPPPPAVEPSPNPSLTRSAPAHQERTPAYKKWWVWTTVAVVVVAGVGVGLGVGLSRGGSSQTTFPSVQF